MRRQQCRAGTLLLVVLAVSIFSIWTGSRRTNNTTFASTKKEINTDVSVFPPLRNTSQFWKRNNDTKVEYAPPMLPRWRGEAVSLAPLLKMALGDLPDRSVFYVVQNGTLGRAPVDRRDKITRYQAKICEQIMIGALKLLQQQHTKQSSSLLFQKRYPRLIRHLDTGFGFLATYGDKSPCDERVPRFSNSVPLDCHFLFGKPSHYLIRQTRASTTQWINKQKRYEKRYPWKNKLTKAVWRGSPTGVRDVSGNTRIALARLSAHNATYRNWLDAGLTRLRWIELLPQNSSSNVSTVKPLKSEDFMRYRAILDVDGNSWSSRFNELLCYNSLILKVQPHHGDYLYYHTQPWEHYVPVKHDLSDLWERLEWVMARANEAAVRNIVDQANRWCRHNLVHARLYRDWLELWELYLKLLDNGDANWTSLWRERNVPKQLEWLPRPSMGQRLFYKITRISRRKRKLNP